MQNIAVFFGGESVEREVSVITGLLASVNLNKFKYNVLPIYLTEQNEMKLIGLKEIENCTDVEKLLKEGKPVALVAPNSFLFEIKKNKLKATKIKIDCAVLATHGGFGENGSLVALLSMCNIASSHGEVFSLSAAMKKSVSKQIFLGLNIKTAKGQVAYSADETIDISYPVVVKPNNLGSSVGVYFCDDENEAKQAIKNVLELDTQALIEEDLSYCRELNCACLKILNDNTFELVTGEIEEPIKKHKVLSYEDKYVGDKNNDDIQGTERGDRIIPAEIDDALKTQIENTTKKIYEAFGFYGVIRIDYFYDEKNNNLIVNEINSIPGSLACFLFKKHFSLSKMLNEMINTAISVFEQNKVKTKTFKTSILKDFKMFKKSSKLKT